MPQTIPPIEETVIVRSPPDRAFHAFLGEFGAWWPAAYTYAGEQRLQDIGLSATVGGLCSEIGPHGFRVDWGRMVAVEPPTRLAFLWQIAPDRTPQPDPAKSSEVEVVFAPGAGGSEVRLIHRAFERCGEGAAAYREGMASKQGWRFILDAYARYLAA
jgi:uncharacterized protein YndB with AHSA1/START domain